MKIKIWLLAFVFVSALVVQTRPANAAEPEGPRVFLDTTYVPNTGGTTYTPMNSSEFQSSLNSAQLGDTIVLQAGTIYTGKFILPNKTTGTGWIIIRTSNMAGIPDAGTRVDPALHAAAMPKIEIATDQAAIETAAQAHHYRLVGLEIRLASNAVNNSNGLVKLGFGDETSETQLPSDITIDRCYIHGTGNINLKRGVNLNSKRSAVIDSYVSKCHAVVFESQAVSGWNSPGPLKVVNNYLEGSAENLFFGGGDAHIPNVIPSDIEIRRNYLFKPTSWRHVWLVKNLLELKSARRVLIEGNVLENNWDSSDVCQTGTSNCGQRGSAVLFTPRNDNGVTPWVAIEDVQFINNRVAHAVAGFFILGHDEGHTSQAAQRIAIRNNLLEDINSTTWGKADGTSHAQLFTLIAGTADPGPTDVHITHNTAFHSGNLLANIVWAEGTPSCTATISGFIFTDNIAPHNSNTNQNGGVAGTCHAIGNDTLNAYFPSPIFTKNVMMGGNSSLYSQYPGNFFPPDWATVRFVNMAAGNYRLASDSPYKNAGTDGKDIGINQDTLEAATSGAKSGIWPDGGCESVTWTNLVGVSVSGTTLTKTSTVAGWNAGATSAQTLSGDGYVEFSTAENGTGKLAGLSNGSANQNYTEIDFAIVLGAANQVRVYENGVLKNSSTNYVAGEKFKVAVEGGVVKYYRDGVLFYTSIVAPTYPLLVDTSLNTPGATITDAIICTTAPPVVWTDLVGVSVSGTTLTKTSTVAGWNAGAISVQTLSGDGSVEFTTNEIGTGKACGLSHTSANQNYTEIDYVITLGAANQLRIYENGVLKGSFGTYVAGERYKVAVEGGVVKYYKDGVLFYTSTIAPTYPLLVDTSLSTTGATIADAVLSGAWSD